ncbi:MAG TPA: methyl-accepting chemotaxis protein [Aquimonas sp.]|nr:methyl-accepting chemotaxis protein [Aquimonas sp.]
MEFRKLLLSLSAAGVIAAVLIGLIGFWGQARLASAASQLSFAVQALQHQQQAVSMHAGLRTDVLDSMVASFMADPSSGMRIEQAIKDHAQGLRDALAANAALPLDPATLEGIAKLQAPVDEYVRQAEEIFTIATEEDAYAASSILVVFGYAYDDVATGLTALTEQIQAMQVTASDDVSRVRIQVTIAQLFGLLLLAVGLLMWGWRITRRVMDQLGGDPSYAAQVVRRITDGELEHEVLTHGDGPSLLADMRTLQGELRAFQQAQLNLGESFARGETEHRLDAAEFPGAYGEMGEAVNRLVDGQLAVQQRVLAVIANYAKGDFRQDMERLPGRQLEITRAVDAVKQGLTAIKTDILRLSEAAGRGDFSARGDASRFEHDFRDMVLALNRLMEQADAGLSDVGNLLEGIAQGDLTRAIQRNYDGAFGQLATDANVTVSNLTRIIQQIKQATDAIQTAAAEIAAGNNDLSGRTEQQAHSLERTAVSMSHLTSTVRQNAESALQANQLAIGAAQVAEKGGSVVSDVVQTMSAIDASSKKIVDIISVIDGIAFQTNILALNAAVEAARAGEQGRGFAVVAAEVRSLAQRSAAAAKEIKVLITDSVSKVKSGSALVDQAGRTMGEIRHSVQRVTDIMGEISAASKEQSDGIAQVTDSVSQMDQATQQNAALVEEASAAARALEDQAEELAAAVSAFRLDQAAVSRLGATAARRPAQVLRVETAPIATATLLETEQPSATSDSPEAATHDAMNLQEAAADEARDESGDIQPPKQESSPLDGLPVQSDTSPESNSAPDGEPTVPETTLHGVVEPEDFEPEPPTDALAAESTAETSVEGDDDAPRIPPPPSSA